MAKPKVPSTPSREEIRQRLRLQQREQEGRTNDLLAQVVGTAAGSFLSSSTRAGNALARAFGREEVQTLVDERISEHLRNPAVLARALLDLSQKDREAILVLLDKLEEVGHDPKDSP